MSLFVSLERVGSGNLKPSTVFNRTFHTSPHVKSAVSMRKGVKGHYELAEEKAGLLIFKPKKAKPGATTYYFVDIENVAAQRASSIQKAKAPKAPKPAKAAPAPAAAANGDAS